jgi:phenylpyruvate tautomerase PptA (4-oxalocrotonate tautomerase family)
MPLWIIYHPPTTFQTTLEKQSLAKDITAIYTAVPLPAFYVNVIFQEVQPGSFWIGGLERTGEGEEKPWIRM